MALSGDGWFRVIADVFGGWVFVASSNNDAKVPLKQMTRILGNSKYKVSLKKTLGGKRSFSYGN